MGRFWKRWETWIWICEVGALGFVRGFLPTIMLKEKKVFYTAGLWISPRRTRVRFSMTVMSCHDFFLSPYVALLSVFLSDTHLSSHLRSPSAVLVCFPPLWLTVSSWCVLPVPSSPCLHGAFGLCAPCPLCQFIFSSCVKRLSLTCKCVSG